MRLLLDEMLSPAIARELTARGHDIGRIVAALEAKINQYPEQDGLANAEDWL